MAQARKDPETQDPELPWVICCLVPGQQFDPPAFQRSPGREGEGWMALLNAVGREVWLSQHWPPCQLPSTSPLQPMGRLPAGSLQPPAPTFRSNLYLKAGRARGPAPSSHTGSARTTAGRSCPGRPR